MCCFLLLILFILIFSWIFFIIVNSFYYYYVLSHYLKNHMMWEGKVSELPLRLVLSVFPAWSMFLACLPKLNPGCPPNLTHLIFVGLSLITHFLFKFLHFLYVGVLPTYLLVHHSGAWYLCWPEEGIRSPGIGVKQLWTSMWVLGTRVFWKDIQCC